MSSIHTIYPGYRDPAFFTPENVAYISNILTETMGKEFRQRVVFTDSSIMRTMQRVFEERYETIPQMNQRVVLELLRNARNEFDETERANYLMSNIWEAYNYDPILGIKPYDNIKLNRRYRGLKFNYTF